MFHLASLSSLEVLENVAERDIDCQRNHVSISEFKGITKLAGTQVMRTAQHHLHTKTNTSTDQ